MTPLAAWWEARSRAARIAIAVAGVVLAYNALSWVVTRTVSGPPPSGPPSSSFSTTPRGVQALAELLEAFDHPVVRVREELAEFEAPPDATLLVIDAPTSAEDRAAVAAAVRAGASAVLAGRATAPLARALIGADVRWAAEPDADGSDEAPRVRARSVAGAPETAPVATVTSAGQATFRELGGAQPLLETEAGVLAVAAPVGAGRVVVIADSTVLQNRYLAQTDNAAFALAAVGTGRGAYFAEEPHGYGRAIGLSALPSRVRIALWLAAAATVAWMWFRSRRLGPPEDLVRRLPPPRSLYVDALATTLARTGDRAGAVQPLVEDTRARLARRAGLGPDVSDDDLRQAARTLGIAEGDIEAVLRPVATDIGVLAVGHARARIEERTRLETNR